jgi:putative ABC transport system permease protein
VLVVAGLMIGTAIISVSFVVGDTLDNMISNNITSGAGDVDFVVAVNDKQGGYSYYDQTFYDELAAKVQGIEHVKAAVPLVVQSVGAQSLETGLSTATLTVTGTNSSSWSHFGGWTDGSGSIAEGPSVTGCYVFQNTAKALGINVGGHLLLARGNSTIILTVERLVDNNEPGASNISTNAFMDIGTLDSFLGSNGKYNVLFINVEPKSGDMFGYDDTVRTALTPIVQSYHPVSDMRIIFDVKKDLDSGKANAQMFTQLFFVFGSFSVIAGVVLVVNIFTMLGEERKSEMGMARALGMRRADLRRLFTYEGLLYALVASLIGTLIGLLMAYVMVYAISGMINFGSVNLIGSFTFTPFSLAIAFVMGFLITITTVYLATSRISNLNIVRAVKNVPEPPLSRGDKRSFRLGMVALIGGLLIMIFGISERSLGPAMSGLSMMTMSTGLLLRKYLSDRIAWNIAGWATLVLWLPKPNNYQIFGYVGGIELFVVSGLFMVTSALIIVIFNSDAIVGFITKVFRVKNGYRAVIKTSVSYPLRAKFRTGLSIFIFGLVIFTVTVLSMMSGILNVGIQKAIGETSGGFDLIGVKYSPGAFPAEPWEMINNSASYGLTGYIENGNITNMVGLGAMPVTVGADQKDAGGNVTYKEKTTQAIGYDQRFYTEGNFPLKDWNKSIYASESEVYLAAIADPSLVILDGSWQSPQMAFGPGGSNMYVNVGQTIQVRSIYGITENVTVVGIMKQSFFSGVFVQKAHVEQAYGAVGVTIMLINFKPGLDVQEQAALLERELIGFSVVTINVQAIAKEVTKIIDSVFTLFQAFLSMGLVIGITGLGIITIRSIHERRLEIGMMRAIGYTKRMVVANFAIESAFIAALGILVGTILGVAVGYEMYQSTFQGGSFDFEFVINWVPITVIGAGAFVATLLCVYPAARGASRVSPAEVLRFE